MFLCILFRPFKSRGMVFLEMRYDNLGVELVCLAHCNSFGSIYLPSWLFLLLFIWVLLNVNLI